MTASAEPSPADPVATPAVDEGDETPDRPPTRPWGRHAVELAVGAGLLLLSWLLLEDRRDVVPGWETDVFRALNDLTDVLRWPLWPIMQLGNLSMLSVGAVIAYLVTRRWGPAVASGAAVLLAWVLAQALKDGIERGRPAELLDGVHLRDSGADGFGYPSGHAAVSFALATVLTPLLPGRWRAVPYTLAVLVGIARVYFGAHLPLDVIAGAGLGILCGLVASAIIGTAAPNRAERVG